VRRHVHTPTRTVTVEDGTDCGNDCNGPSGHAEGCPVHCRCYDVPPSFWVSRHGQWGCEQCPAHGQKDSQSSAYSAALRHEREMHP
jgi:hypothetical protein